MYRIECYADISFFFFNLILGIFFFVLSEPHARKDIVWKAQRDRPHTHYPIIDKVIVFVIDFFFSFSFSNLGIEYDLGLNFLDRLV